MRLRIAGAVLGVLAGANAWGSGFYLLEQNASGLGRAFAGTAAIADDASTVFFNPAGLARLPELQLVVAASAINVNTRFHDAGSTAALGQPLGHSGGNAGGLSAVPALYLSVPFAGSFTFGLGVNAPYGLKTEYDSGWAGRFQGMRSEVKTINVNPTLAWAPTPHVSIGIGLNYQRLQATLTNAVNYSAVVYSGAYSSAYATALQQGATPAQAAQAAAAAAGALLQATGPLEGTARIEGDDTAWAFNVGALFDVGEATRVGLAYRSAVKYGVGGDVDFGAPTTAVPNAALIIQVASGSVLADGPVGLDLKLPDTATASLVQKVSERLTLSFDAAWTGWSSVPELRIVRTSGTVLSTTPEHWQDAWRFALGGDLQLSSSWTVRAGVAFDQAPVPDSTRTPRLPDGDRTWIALGAAWNPSDAVRVDVGYAHLFVKGAPLNQDGGSAPSYGVLVGEQKTKIDILAAQFRVRF
ncbi:MAG: outer membrane protein transport protein [Gammaproteobacteria bacterium]|nr:outer membrane protein transport protein [Gammaproteobacteria bacterium]